MSLVNFSVISPSIEPGDLLSSLDIVIPQETIAQAIEQSNSQHQRKRSLPTHVVVALVIAMSFWATDSIVDVFKKQAAPEEMNLFMSWLIAEILDNQLPPREGRINPRVVKKPRSKFKTAKPEHRGQGTKLQRLDFRVSQLA
jgi:hypothetical protein